jgi:two-component system nitrogen regulation sensor histidine kinase GlnL
MWNLESPQEGPPPARSRVVAFAENFSPMAASLPNDSLPSPTSSLWQDVLTHFNDAVVVMDQETRIVLFNQAAEELLQTSQSHVIGKRCNEIFQDTPLVTTMVKHVSRSRQGESRGDEQLNCKTRVTTVRLTCLPLWGRHSALEGIALVIQDVGHKKTLEETARRNESLARLGTMVAGLAHEVRNPLAGIKGAAQLLNLKLAGRADVAEYTEVITREADRLSGLVEDLLTIGAPPKPQLQVVNIHRVIQNVLAVLEPEMTASAIVIKLEFDPSLPDLDADPRQLSQVFLNILHNAIEATDLQTNGGNEPATIQIHTRMETDFHILRQREGRDSYLRVEVIDGGPGIEPAEASRVFEPFFTTKAKGTGLGLPISHKIVSEHGGIIRVSRNQPRGTTVSVSLPIPRN